MDYRSRSGTMDEREEEEKDAKSHSVHGDIALHILHHNLNITLPASMGINLKRKDKFINCYESRVRLWLTSLSRKRSYRG